MAITLTDKYQVVAESAWVYVTDYSRGYLKLYMASNGFTKGNTTIKYKMTICCNNITNYTGYLWNTNTKHDYILNQDGVQKAKKTYQQGYVYHDKEYLIEESSYVFYHTPGKDWEGKIEYTGYLHNTATSCSGNIKILANVTKPEITGIAVSDVTYNSGIVTLTSTNGNGTLNRYEVQLYKDNTWITTQNQSSNIFTFIGLEPESTYLIKAWSKNEEMGWSEEATSSLTTVAPTVGEPIIENFSIINAEKIKLKCNASNEPNISGGIPKLYYRIKKGQEEILNSETVGSLDSEFNIEPLEQNNTLVAYIVGGFTYNGKTYYSKEVESKLIRFIPNSWMEIFPFNSTQSVPVEVYICPYGETNNTKLILIQSSRTQGGG